MRTTETSVAAAALAREILEASDSELPLTVSRLRASKRLFSTVHKLNLLLEMPQYEAMAMQALKRLGLDRPG